MVEIVPQVLKPFLAGEAQVLLFLLDFANPLIQLLESQIQRFGLRFDGLDFLVPFLLELGDAPTQLTGANLPGLEFRILPAAFGSVGSLVLGNLNLQIQFVAVMFQGRNFLTELTLDLGQLVDELGVIQVDPVALFLERAIAIAQLVDQDFHAGKFAR